MSPPNATPTTPSEKSPSLEPATQSTAPAKLSKKKWKPLYIVPFSFLFLFPSIANYILTSLTQYSKSRNGPPNRPQPSHAAGGGGHSHHSSGSGHHNDSYNQSSQTQHQQPSWAAYSQPQQQQPAAGAPPGVAGVTPGVPADPSDPYAPYGGYQAYCAMYYAAMMQQQAGNTGSAAPGT